MCNFSFDGSLTVVLHTSAEGINLRFNDTEGNSKISMALKEDIKIFMAFTLSANNFRFRNLSVQLNWLWRSEIV